MMACFMKNILIGTSLLRIPRDSSKKMKEMILQKYFFNYGSCEEHLTMILLRQIVFCMKKNSIYLKIIRNCAILTNSYCIELLQCVRYGKKPF